MSRILGLIISVYMLFAWADVSVEKVLETESIREYNQWVASNINAYPALSPIRVTATNKISVKDKKSENIIYYYDDNGQVNGTEKISENCLVKVSPYYNAIGIYEGNHPYLWPSRTLIKYNSDNVILDTQYIYLAFISSSLCITIPTDDNSPPNPSVEIFDISTGSWTNTLSDCWMLNERDVVNSSNNAYTVFSISKDSDYDCNHVILIDSKGHEVWRKTFQDDPQKFGGLNVALASDTLTVVVAKDEYIYIYNTNGNLRRTYTLPNVFPAQCDISDDGKYLWVATRNAPKGSNKGCLVLLYDNNTGVEIWRNDYVEEEGPLKINVSGDGRFALIQFYPNVVYLIKNDGTILKRWVLDSKVHSPITPCGQEGSVTQPMRTRLELHKNLALIINESNAIQVVIWKIEED